MQTVRTTNGRASEAAIFARLWETENGEMSPEAARIIVGLAFSAADRARMHELAVRNQESGLSPEDGEELDGYVKAGDLLAILQSKARILLKKVEGKKRRHG